MYSEAQALIDDTAQTGPVALGLRVLMALARVLRQRRLDSGALLLASTEVPARPCSLCVLVRPLT